MKKTFEALISDKSLRFALFLDGDHGDLVDLIIAMSSQVNVKICSASRTWLLFEDAFESKPSPLLEDLTERDIRQYVHGKFNQHKRYQQLRRSKPQYARKLVDNVVKKATGVFLWVYLVVNSLLNGLTNADRVSDLQKRLDLLPEGLEDLFQKLLKGVEGESLYYPHACQMLLTIFEAQIPPSLLAFSFADEEDDAKIIGASHGPLPNEERAKLFECTRRRLKSHCKGLLEVAHPQGKPKTVRFLHRTVKDFIAQLHIKSQLSSAAGSSFNPARRLANGYLRETQIEGTLDSSVDRTPEIISDSVLCTLKYALRSERRTGEVLVDFLDSLCTGITTDMRIYRKHSIIVQTLNGSSLELDNFLELALLWGHLGYIRFKLPPSSKAFQRFSKDQLTNLLWYTLKMCLVTSDLVEELSLLETRDSLETTEGLRAREMCWILLENGADPSGFVWEVKGLDKELQNMIKPYIQSPPRTKFHSHRKEPGRLSAQASGKRKDRKEEGIEEHPKGAPRT